MEEFARLRSGLLQRTGSSPRGALGSAGELVTAAWVAGPPAAVLARSRTTDTAVIEVAGLGRVVRKRWWWRGSMERWKGVGRTTALAPSPAEREFEALQSPAGNFHPPPIAWGTWRVRGWLHRCLLLVTEIPGAVDLAMWLREERDPTLRRAVLADLAGRVAAMHAAGVEDGDLHPRNVLVAPDGPRVWKVDCARQRRHGSLRQSAVVHDLACLDVGLARFAKPRERARALVAYAPRNGRRHLAVAVEAERRGLAEKEERRLPQIAADDDAPTTGPAAPVD